ncbi:MAG: hypothetical protein AUJ96_01485 [Armatimonadetes bacterium CG2_30_66_41]|nr:MAG: hypothetical protein AUJ96_01485 [Armatimonadetes bacterium CG2_30_66_41]
MELCRGFLVVRIEHGGQAEGCGGIRLFAKAEQDHAAVVVEVAVGGCEATGAVDLGERPLVVTQPVVDPRKAVHDGSLIGHQPVRLGEQSQGLGQVATVVGQHVPEVVQGHRILRGALCALDGLPVERLGVVDPAGLVGRVGQQEEVLDGTVSGGTLPENLDHLVVLLVLEQGGQEQFAGLKVVRLDFQHALQLGRGFPGLPALQGGDARVQVLRDVDFLHRPAQSAT